MERMIPERGSHFYLTLLLIVLATVLVATPLDAADDGTAAPIRLRSRVFTPATGEFQPAPASTSAQRWHGLIQLDGAPTQEQRNALAALGVTLLDYIPTNTWIASMPANAGPAMQVPGVLWLGGLEPADRVDPALHDGAVSDWAQRGDQAALWLEYFSDVPTDRAIALAQAHGGTVTESLPDYYRLHVTLPPAQIWALAATDAFQWIAEAPPPQETTNDGSRAVIEADAVQASPYNLAGRGVQAAIWDTSVIDANHPDFSGRVTTVDTHAATGNHATHVAGILGGDGANSETHGGQPRQWRGMAPEVEILSYYWDGPTVDHDSAINLYGADVSQNSWALGGCSYHGYYDRYASDYDSIITGRYGRQIPIVFAAGNQALSCSSPYGTVHGGPQSAKNVLTIGAINSSDSSLVSSSSRGPTVDGRLKPELVAAGQTANGVGIYSTVQGGGYGNFVGTSMAAPAASGSIALVLEQYHNICPAAGDSDGNPLPATSRALLIHSARDLRDPALAYINSGPDFASGYGVIDDRAAVDLVPRHVEGSVATGDLDLYPVQVAPGQATLKVTLVWDDAPGAANAAAALVNDLDLEVMAPDGQTVHGPWILQPNQPAAPAQRPVWQAGQPPTRDTRNVVEQVVVDNPVAGTWHIRIIGSNVPQGLQTYSVVSENLQDNSCEVMPTNISLLGTGLEARGADMPARLLPLLLAAITLAVIVSRRRRARAATP